MRTTINYLMVMAMLACGYGVWANFENDGFYGPITTTGGVFTPVISFDLNCGSCAVAESFIAHTTSPITGIDCYVHPIGTMTGIDFNYYIASDSTTNPNFPSINVLGSSTPAIAGTSLAALGGDTGIQTFAAATPALTINNRYWIVISTDPSATIAPTAANAIHFYQNSTAIDGGTLRQSTGTWWNGSFTASEPDCILQHQDGTYDGYLTSATSNGLGIYVPASKIFGSNVAGLRFMVKPGTEAYLAGFKFLAYKIAPPGDFVMNVFQGNTLVASSTMPASAIISGNQFTQYLSTPAWVNSSTWTYVIFQQSGGQGTSGTYWSFYSTASDPNYMQYEVTSDLRYVYGNTPTKPNSLTVFNGALPRTGGPLIKNWRNETNVPQSSAH